jgi:hypothetical protein
MGNVKVLLIIDPIYAPYLLAQRMSQQIPLPIDDIPISSSVNGAIRKHEGENMAVIVLGLHMNTDPVLVTLQVQGLKARFPDSAVVLYGLYDLGYKAIGADYFVPFVQPQSLIDFVRTSIASTNDA